MVSDALQKLVGNILVAVAEDIENRNKIVMTFVDEDNSPIKVETDAQSFVIYELAEPNPDEVEGPQITEKTDGSD